MSEPKRKVGRPRKKTPPLVESPAQFEADPELDITEMQAAFVWHYTEGACGQTEAARRAGFAFPAASASKMLDGELPEGDARCPHEAGRVAPEVRDHT